MNFARFSALTVASTGMLTASAMGQVTIIDTDFTAAEGYVDGLLQFQGANIPTLDGVWLGQNGVEVDSSGTGTATQTGSFRRNLYQIGATGGTAGGDGSNENAGTGFAIGDKVSVSHAYSFTLENPDFNIDLLSTGIRQNFVNGGFEAAPIVGIEIGYSEFAEGTLKVFSDFTRAATNGADNEFAFFVSSAEAGLDSGFTSGTVDAVSDNLRFTWEAEYTGVDTWTTTEIMFENLDTEIMKLASVENPSALETVTVAGSGLEGYFAFQPTRVPFASPTSGTTDAVSYIYTAASVTGGLAGDYSENGTVEQSDLNLVLTNWGTDRSFEDPGGTAFSSLLVDQEELNLVLSNWGSSSAPSFEGSSVPEPATAAVLAMLGLAGLRRRGH